MNATVQILTYAGSNYVEIKIFGKVDQNREFVIICSPREAEEVAHQLMRTASTVRMSTLLSR